ncbi:MAG: hypothetical protein L0Y60_04545, partial [Beijerinckiaceae bacterium]|nr:hypothetical protein [Beijerinckiaceae bacterium]
KQGALYGTTPSGGTLNRGTVFKLTPPAAGKAQWTETVLYRGHGSSGGLIFDKAGALYGSPGTGMVFRLTPPAPGQTQWTKTVLRSNGLGPTGLVFDKQGALYGTIEQGGPSPPVGAVVKLAPPAAGKTQWTETVLYSFKDHHYGYANPGLIFDKQGALYGTTNGGGAYMGTVFKLTPPGIGQTQWTWTLLNQFGRTTNGGLKPYAGLILDNTGALYGTTSVGGFAPDPLRGFGTVFKLTGAAPAAAATQEEEQE